MIEHARGSLPPDERDRSSAMALRLCTLRAPTCANFIVASEEEKEEDDDNYMPRGSSLLHTRPRVAPKRTSERASERAARRPSIMIAGVMQILGGGGGEFALIRAQVAPAAALQIKQAAKRDKKQQQVTSSRFWRHLIWLSRSLGRSACRPPGARHTAKVRPSRKH